MAACFLLQQKELYPIGTLDHWWYLRFSISLVIGVLVLVWAKIRILDDNRPQPLPGQTVTQTAPIPYVIAFDITVFLVAGMALVITASREWATACLCGGSCLLAGGFVGLLFGVPYGRTTAEMISGSKPADKTNGTDKDSSPPPPPGGKDAKPMGGDQDPGPGAAEPPVPEGAPLASPAPPHPGPVPNIPTPVPGAASVGGAGNGPAAMAAAAASATGRNLLEDTASSLSKLLTGASLVKLGDIYRFFQTTSWKVGYYLTDGNLQAAPGTTQQYASTNIAVMGGALILYFLFLGFLSGLFLPAYFMKGWDD